MQRSFTRSLAVVAAIGLLVVPAASASSTLYDTRDDSLTTYISSFSVPNTATFGQTFETSAAGGQRLESFTFRVESLPSTIYFQGEVFAWDAGSGRATGAPLYESGARTTAGTALQDITFDAGAVSLQPSTKYVVFVSHSRFTEISSGSGGRFRSRLNNSLIPNGDFVFLSNGTDESQWTSATWSTINEDLQMRIRITSPTQALSITESGNGSGTVVGSAGGVNCGSLCSVVFGDGTALALQANPAAGSTFAGFTGSGCNTSPCGLLMDDDKTVDARFEDNVKPKTTITKRNGAKVYFASNEPGSTFRCKLDKGKAKTCRSPYALKRLKAGRHSFSVYATDKGGNKGRAAKLKFAT